MLEILENAVALPMAVAVEGVDIDAAFTGGTVPVKVAEALRKTNITVGKVLHVTPDLHPDINSLHRNWIITDGSRRWLVQHQTQQFILFIFGVGNVQVRDVAGAVASMNNGTRNAELEGRLSQGLPIHGAPQIEAIPAPSGIVQAWVARYTRAIAIKIMRGSPMGTVELFRLNGRQIKVYELNGKTIQIIAQASLRAPLLQSTRMWRHCWRFRLMRYTHRLGVPFRIGGSSVLRPGHSLETCWRAYMYPA